MKLWHLVTCTVLIFTASENVLPLTMLVLGVGALRSFSLDHLAFFFKIPLIADLCITFFLTPRKWATLRFPRQKVSCFAAPSFWRLFWSSRETCFLLSSVSVPKHLGRKVSFLSSTWRLQIWCLEVWLFLFTHTLQEPRSIRFGNLIMFLITRPPRFST